MNTRLALPVFLLIALLQTPTPGWAQDGPSSLRLRAEPERYHPRNDLFELVVLLDPSLRPNDFIRTFSPFDSVRVPASLMADPSLREDLRHWFEAPRSLIRIGYHDEEVEIDAEPILGMSLVTRNDRSRYSLRTNGLKIYGRITDRVTFYASAVDNAMRGPDYALREITTQRWHVPSSLIFADGYDFDETDAQIGYDFGYGAVYIEKMRNNWGYEQRGNIILSDQAPSFPQLRLEVNLFRKIRFTYLHGFLYSDVKDTLFSDPRYNQYRGGTRSKYYAAHLLEYAPIPQINIALGESVVYSDRLEAAYLNPLVFIRSADHQNSSRDNAQVFWGARWSFLPGHRVFVSMFIDDISIPEIFSDKNINIFSFSAGWNAANFPMHDVDLVVEYTRSNPWVYTHNDRLTDYSSNSLPLGHWLEQNSDLLFVSATWRAHRTLRLTVFAELARKGERGPDSLHYGYPWEQKFLVGKTWKRQNYGLALRWQIWQPLHLNAVVTLSTLSNSLLPDLAPYKNDILAQLGLHYNLYHLLR